MKLFRKLVCLMLSLALVCSMAGAVAEEPFTFLNGLTWGMSAEQVGAVEGKPADISTFEGRPRLTSTFVGMVAVHTVYVTISHYFIDDQLAMVNYIFKTVAENCTSVYNGLVESYGEPEAYAELDEKIVESYDAVDGTTENAEMYASWTPCEGTRVQMFNCNGRCYVTYINTEADWTHLDGSEEPAPAEPAPTEAAPVEATPAEASAFSFRGGVHWGMTRDEVAAVEGIPAQSDEFTFSSQISGVYYAPVTVSKFNGAAAYIFIGDAAHGCMLQLDATSDDAEYLLSAMTIVYGESAGPIVSEVMNTFLTLAGLSDGMTVDAAWMSGDTAILMMEADGGLYLLYLDTAADWSLLVDPEPTPEPPVTQGL